MIRDRISVDYRRVSVYLICLTDNLGGTKRGHRDFGMVYGREVRYDQCKYKDYMKEYRLENEQDRETDLEDK